MLQHGNERVGGSEEEEERGSKATPTDSGNLIPRGEEDGWRIADIVGRRRILLIDKWRCNPSFIEVLLKVSCRTEAYLLHKFPFSLHRLK